MMHRSLEGIVGKGGDERCPPFSHLRRSIRAFASRVAPTFQGGIHTLINNAGVLNPPTKGSHITEDGIEVCVVRGFGGGGMGAAMVGDSSNSNATLTQRPHTHVFWWLTRRSRGQWGAGWKGVRFLGVTEGFFKRRQLWRGTILAGELCLCIFPRPRIHAGACAGWHTQTPAE